VGQNIIKSFNPHMKYVNLDDHGFYYLDVRKTRTQADYKFNTVTSLGANQSNGPSYKVDVNAKSISLGAAVAPAPFHCAYSIFDAKSLATSHENIESSVCDYRQQNRCLPTFIPNGYYLSIAPK
jgi:hypothetical protein